MSSRISLENRACSFCVELGAQGFLFSKAVPAESVDELLSSPGSWLRGIDSPQDASPLS